MKTPENKEKVIISDHFLKRDVYKSIMTRIKSQNLKNIVIIGGSHSGYSCAWMILSRRAINIGVRIVSFAASAPGLRRVSALAIV